MAGRSRRAMGPAQTLEDFFLKRLVPVVAALAVLSGCATNAPHAPIDPAKLFPAPKPSATCCW